MKNLAILLLLLLSGLWYFISYKYLSGLIPNSIINQYNNYSILIFLAWIFVFWILFWKLLSQKENDNKKKTIKKDFIISKEDNIFNTDIKEIEKVTYYNYENDSDITKDSIDIILDEREENYKHKINLKNETLKDTFSTKKQNVILKNKKINKKIDAEVKNQYEDKMFLWVSNNLKKQKKQDLKIIEGIWPKIEELLNKWWIYSYKDLVDSEIEKIKSILEKASKRYVILHNPITWPKQASFALKWNFDELKKYQDKLVKWVEIK